MTLARSLSIRIQMFYYSDVSCAVYVLIVDRMWHIVRSHIRQVRKTFASNNQIQPVGVGARAHVERALIIIVIICERWSSALAFLRVRSAGGSESHADGSVHCVWRCGDCGHAECGRDLIEVYVGTRP